MSGDQLFSCLKCRYTAYIYSRKSLPMYMYRVIAAFYAKGTFIDSALPPAGLLDVTNTCIQK